MEQTRQRKKQVTFHMGPVTWVLLITFILAVLVTGYLTFMVVREWVLSESPIVTFMAPILQKNTPDPLANSPLDRFTPLQGENGPAAKPWKGSERVTMLLLGLDLRDWEDGGPSHTDTMMLFTMDPETHTAAMLSIPRDTWVNIPGFDYGKINTAHFLGDAYDLPGGGPGLAVDTVENFLGIEINYYARVDFNAFITFIDELGGVEVDVPEEMRVDPIGPNNTVYLEPGLTLLDGATALAYARNRDLVGDDFNRAQRQQQVVMAIRDRILKLEMLPDLIKKSPTLYLQLSSGIQTNLSLDEAVKLTWLAKQIPTENIRSATLGWDQLTSTMTPDGLDILLPDIEAVRTLVDSLFTTAPPVGPAEVAELGNPVDLMKEEAATVAVLNATYTPGLAARTMEYLLSQGVNVVTAGNAQEASEFTSLIAYSGMPNSIQYLASQLNIDSSHIYFRNDPNSQVDITILLGADWANNNTIP
jgi:LCP family protein required for cell wall assembly